MSEKALRTKLVECSQTLTHRGPDWSGYHVDGDVGIAHERLAIIDPDSGAQPLVSRDENVIVAANGEIYNYQELLEGLSTKYVPRTGSDCECVIPLYQQLGIENFPNVSFLSFFLSFLVCILIAPSFPSISSCMHVCACVFQSTNVFILFFCHLVDNSDITLTFVTYLNVMFLQELRGMFSFIIFDKSDRSYYAVRDQCGITPLYIGYGTDGSVWIGSEMKSLAKDCARFEPFLPGHYYSSKVGKMTRWYNPVWKEAAIPTHAYDKAALRAAFTKSVQRRMMSDVPWGVLLSGGLDSSLVASVANKLMKESEPSLGDSHSHNSFCSRLHSFCVGLENSPDLVAAKKVADFIGTIHHQYTYSIQEGLDAISKVIYHLETYDVTTIRASTPMYLMSRKIKAMGVKMVLSGEGADEVFGGYLYFHKAPNEKEFHEELKDKINNLYLFDCLRANKCTSAWGVEARVPFLDRDFLDVAMNINPRDKMIDLSKSRMEKWILRDAFDTPEDPYLPHDVLWRQKEQFSDGVGYGWIDSLRDVAEQNVTDQMFKAASQRYPYNTPVTKEAYYYRSIFEQHYPQQAACETVPGGPSIACSTARAIEWDESFKGRADCSGRAVSGVHETAYDEKFDITSDQKKAVANGESPSKKSKKHH